MNRAQMLNGLDEILQAAKESKAKGTVPTIFIPQVQDLSDDQKAEDEYESLGYFVTYNPLEKYRNKLLQLINTSDLPDIMERSTVKMGGLMTNLKQIMTKKGKPMAFFELEDLNGKVEVVAFTHVYNKNKHLFEKNKPVHVVGKLESDTRFIGGEEVTKSKIILMSVGELELGQKLIKINIHPKEKDDFVKIHDIIVANPGDIPIDIEYQGAVIKQKYSILYDKEVLEKLEVNCLIRREYVT